MTPEAGHHLDMKQRIFVISGPSGSGKTSILEKLFRKKEIRDTFFKVLTFTTRSPRSGEKHGKDYFFLSRKEFLSLKRKRFFLETKQYLDHFYATPKEFYSQARGVGKSPIFCIDVEGALKVKKKFGSRVRLIFIAPPSDDVLKQRLYGRKTEEEGILKKRLRIAKKEVKYAEKYNHILVNDSLSKTVTRVKEVLLLEVTQSRLLRKKTSS